MIRSRIRRDGWIDEFGKWHRHPTCPRQGGGLSHFHAVKFRWSIAPPPPLLARRLTDELRVSPLLARCLVNRGLTEQDRAADFLQPRLRQLSDPFLLPNMAAAVEVIRLDHHQVSNPPPLATALVNPRSGTGTFTELCSVGLAFKLAHALVKRGRETGLAGAQNFDLRPLLDLVALGTVADLVPLTGENRILVTTGLQRLQGTPRPGLIALKAVAEVKGPIGVYEVGFQLGPRLNAAGRLETAVEALNLLLAQNLTEAEPLARDLDARNRERQQIERSIAEEAIGAVRAKFDAQTDYVIVEGQLLWHVGVVGIVASRVLREFHRPTIIIGGEAEEWRGSGRSIEGFDLAAALRECQDLLVRHGGHAMAAGLSIRSENLDALRTRLNELARGSLTREQLQPLLRLDAEGNLSELTLERLEELQRLEPVGQGNPPVQLVVRHVTLHRPPQRMGRAEQHTKLWVTDAGGVREVVWWNCGAAAARAGRFDPALVPQTNEYH